MGNRFGGDLCRQIKTLSRFNRHAILSKRHTGPKARWLVSIKLRSTESVRRWLERRSVTQLAWAPWQLRRLVTEMRMTNARKTVSQLKTFGINFASCEMSG